MEVLSSLAVYVYVTSHATVNTAYSYVQWQACAAVWCVQHVPYLRLSQYCMKSHQSVAPQHWIIAWERPRCANAFMRGLGIFSPTKTFYLFIRCKHVKDWEDLCNTFAWRGQIIYSAEIHKGSGLKSINTFAAFKLLKCDNLMLFFGLYDNILTGLQSEGVTLNSGKVWSAFFFTIFCHFIWKKLIIWTVIMTIIDKSFFLFSRFCKAAALRVVVFFFIKIRRNFENLSHVHVK